MDLALALVPSLLFGTMALLLGRWPTDARRQNAAVMAGAGLVSLLAAAVMGASWSAAALLWGTVSGLLWSLGQVLVLRGFRSWGVSRTMPLTTALQLLLNATLGVVLFHEWRSPGAMAMGVVSLVAIMAGAAACSWQEPSGPGPDATARRTGILATAGSALLYGLYPSLLRLADVSASQALGPMGLGLLLGAVVVVLVLPRGAAVVGERSLPAAAAGGVWAVGNAFLLRSTTAIGVASGFTLSQLGFVIATVGGMTLLGEAKSRRETVASLAGVASAVVGLVLMGMASGRG